MTNERYLFQHVYDSPNSFHLNFIADMFFHMNKKITSPTNKSEENRVTPAKVFWAAFSTAVETGDVLYAFTEMVIFTETWVLKLPVILYFRANQSSQRIFFLNGEGTTVTSVIERVLHCGLFLASLSYKAGACFQVLQVFLKAGGSCSAATVEIMSRVVKMSS